MEARSSREMDTTPALSAPGSPSSLSNASFRSVAMSPTKDLDAAPDKLDLTRETSNLTDRSAPSASSPKTDSRPVLDIGAIMASRVGGDPADDDIDSPLERRISDVSDLSGTASDVSATAGAGASASAWGSSSASAFANGSAATTAAASALFGNRMNASAVHKEEGDGTSTPTPTATTAASSSASAAGAAASDAVPIPSRQSRSNSTASGSSPKSPVVSPLGPIAESILSKETARQSLIMQKEREKEADKEEFIASSEEEKDKVPATMPDMRTPSKHKRNESAASAMSQASQVSSVSFEEVGFGDESPGWKEDPLYAASEYSRASSQFGSPAARLYNGGPATASPAASERTIYGNLANSTSSQKTASLGLSNVSTMVREGDVDLVLGVAVVDFNHLIGPTVEFAYPQSLHDALMADENFARLLPFLALPDGAHLSEEDYSYFHCTFNPTGPTTSEIPPRRTLFGISCNRQIASADLLQKSSDVTRSMVQKAVIVLASQPVFGPVRDRLGVVTKAFFAQRDFGSTQILQDFYTSLEASLEGKAGESAIYMGTSLRELVHKFRHRTLILLKLLLLQRRIMLFGYPVEMLCTYQYSLVSLIPGLLMALRDCGSPELDAKKQRTRPTSLRTSDRASLLRYMGLPLHLFGTDSCFQPYLPLQQIDMLAARSWLVGTTNQIVTQQKDCTYDVLVNIDENTFTFSDPKLERVVALTAADRTWMNEMVRVVEDTYNLSEGERPGFVGSDDDLRARFEEYICAFLASIKYADFIGHGPTTAAAGVTSEPNPLVNFGEPFAAYFRMTPAAETWDQCTDPTIFDLSEPRHPCEGKATAVSDLSIRLSEGLHDLRIDETLESTRETLANAGATVSSTLFRAFDGVRSEVNNRLEAERARRAALAAANGTANGRPISGASQASKASVGGLSVVSETSVASKASAKSAGSTASNPPPSPLAPIGSALGGWGASVSGFFGSKWKSSGPPPVERRNSGLRPMSLQGGSPKRSESPTKRAQQ